jgi:broad specificity phosphatase PhoE
LPRQVIVGRGKGAGDEAENRAMKSIEIRRHAKRQPPLEHLTQEGVTMARRLGQGMGPFERVVTSPLPRAFETALAMGFAVDEQVALLATYGEAIEASLPWPQPFAAYQAGRHQPALAAYLASLLAFYHDLLGQLPEPGAALVISHGGIVEMSALACLPEADYAAEGPIGLCEGLRLSWHSGRFSGHQILRVAC